MKIKVLKIGNKAQISAEMLMLLAALVGLGIFVIKNLGTTAHNTANKLNETAAKFNSSIDDLI